MKISSIDFLTLIDVLTNNVQNMVISTPSWYSHGKDVFLYPQNTLTLSLP